MYKSQKYCITLFKMHTKILCIVQSIVSQYSKRYFPWSEVDIPSFLMSSHLLSIGTGFYRVRSVRYQFDHLSKVVKVPF